MPAVPLATTTLFVYVGAATAAWAVLVAAIGISRPDFPKDDRGERIVIAISALLVAGSIGTAIGTAQQGKHAGEASASSGTAGAAATKLALSADPSGALHFDKTSLTAKSGSVQIVLSNPSPLQHNVSLQGPGVNAHGPTVSHGQTSTVSASLKPGTYTFYCSVPGHRQAGMQGTLTVR